MTQSTDRSLLFNEHESIFTGSDFDFEFLVSYERKKYQYRKFQKFFIVTNKNDETILALLKKNYKKYFIGEIGINSFTIAIWTEKQCFISDIYFNLKNFISIIKIIKSWSKTIDYIKHTCLMYIEDSNDLSLNVSEESFGKLLKRKGGNYEKNIEKKIRRTSTFLSQMNEVDMSIENQSSICQHSVSMVEELSTNDIEESKCSSAFDRRIVNVAKGNQCTSMKRKGGNYDNNFQTKIRRTNTFLSEIEEVNISSKNESSINFSMAEDISLANNKTVDSIVTAQSLDDIMNNFVNRLLENFEESDTDKKLKFVKELLEYLRRQETEKYSVLDPFVLRNYNLRNLIKECKETAIRSLMKS